MRRGTTVSKRDVHRWRDAVPAPTAGRDGRARRGSRRVLGSLPLALRAMLASSIYFWLVKPGSRQAALSEAR